MSKAATFQPHPIPWAEFPTECFYYLYFMTVAHLVAFGIGSAIIGVLPSKEWGAKLRRIRRFALYNGLLLLVGCIFNGFWSCLIWDRLYDSTDYVFDFVPFVPIGHWALDRPWGDERGRLLGVSLFQLQLVWLVFAAGTWAVTTLLYRLSTPLWAANKGSGGDDGVTILFQIRSPLASRASPRSFGIAL